MNRNYSILNQQMVHRLYVQCLWKKEDGRKLRFTVHGQEKVIFNRMKLLSNQLIIEILIDELPDEFKRSEGEMKP